MIFFFFFQVFKVSFVNSNSLRLQTSVPRIAVYEYCAETNP